MIDYSTPSYNKFGVDQRVQQVELDMLKHIHSFCQEHGLTYYIAWGTFLGAMRHGGFIPWDDDVDIVMPREDYMKLISLSGKLDEKYHLACTETTPDYQFSFAKLEYRYSRLVEKNYPEGRHGGVYIDIFPLDPITSNPLLQRLQIWTNVIWKIKSHSLHRFYDTNTKLNWFWKAAGALMRMKYGNDSHSFHVKWEKKHSHPVNDSEWVAEFFDADMNGVMRRELYGKGRLYTFEDAKFVGPEKADEYLTHAYGDWRKLPPEEKRRAFHGFDVEFSDIRLF